MASGYFPLDENASPGAYNDMRNKFAPQQTLVQQHKQIRRDRKLSSAVYVESHMCYSLAIVAFFSFVLLLTAWLAFNNF